MAEFLPRRESALLFWAQFFDGQIASDAESFGLTTQQAADFHAVYEVAVATLALVNNPETRTSLAVLRKNEALNQLRNLARSLAGIVRADPSVTASQRFALGLTTGIDATGTINPPADAPSMKILVAKGMAVTLRISDPTAVRGGKPSGAHGAILFSAIGDEHPASLRDWTFEYNTTVPNNVVNFPATVAPGSMVWFMACWFNPRMQNGPLSTPIYTRLQGGGIVKTAMQLAA